jgi:hypothetical protein
MVIPSDPGITVFQQKRGLRVIPQRVIPLDFRGITVFQTFHVFGPSGEGVIPLPGITPVAPPSTTPSRPLGTL